MKILIKNKYLIYRSSSNVSNSPSLQNEPSTSSQQKDFKCLYCRKKFANRAGCVSHERKHRRDIIKEKRKKIIAKNRRVIHIYRCTICNETFSRKSSFTKHCKKHSQNITSDALSVVSLGVMTNSQTSGMFRTRSMNRLSVKSAPHNQLRNESCYDSEESDNDVEIDHAVFRTKSKDTDEISFCREINCRAVFTSVDTLTLHECEVHNKWPLYKCTECRCRFTSRYSKFYWSFLDLLKLSAFLLQFNY